MTLDILVDKSKITVISLWDEPLSFGNTYNLDVYTNATEKNHNALTASHNKNRSIRTLFTESHMNVIHLDPKQYREKTGVGLALMNPIIVAEIYGTSEGWLVPEGVTNMIIAYMRKKNQQVVPGINVRSDCLSKQFHFGKSIERPLEEITEAIHAVLSVFPTEQTNLVVNDYVMVGSYTLNPGR